MKSRDKFCEGYGRQRPYLLKVKEYRFDSVQAFYKELNAARKEHLAYKAACAEWENAYGEKVADSTSIKERLRQKGKIVKEREAGREHRERQKDKGAR